MSELDILTLTERLGYCDICIRRIPVSFRLGYWLCSDCYQSKKAIVELFHEKGIHSLSPYPDTGKSGDSYDAEMGVRVMGIIRLNCPSCGYNGIVPSDRVRCPYCGHIPKPNLTTEARR